MAVLESAFGAGMGCRLELSRSGLRLDALLFGESAGRIVVTVEPEGESSLARLAQAHRVTLSRLGLTGGSRATVMVDGRCVLDAEAEGLREIHASALEAALQG